MSGLETVAARTDWRLVKFRRARRRTAIHINVGYGAYSLCNKNVVSMAQVQVWSVLTLIGVVAQDIPYGEDEQKKMAVGLPSPRMCAACQATLSALLINNWELPGSGDVDPHEVA